METAIKKAIEGGWEPFSTIKINKTKWGVGEVLANFYHQPTWLLDPKFWQALGKAEGWCYHENAFVDCRCTGTWYMIIWHDFIDHLASGKDIDSFFNELFHD